MQKIRKSVIFLLTLTFILIHKPIDQNRAIPNTDTSALNFLTPQSAEIHPKILIYGNSELDAFFSGNGTDGTKFNPYIIENYLIDAESIGSGIAIRYTDRHLIIRNCTISNSGNAWGDSAIFLKNCSNIIVTSCTLVSSCTGVLVTESHNNTIFNNTVSQSVAHGINIDFSLGNIVSENNISYSSQAGISVGYSYNNTIFKNYITYSEIQGVDLSFSNNNTVSNNIALNGVNHGITLYQSERNSFLGNVIAYNDVNGIRLQFSDNNTLSNNTIIDNMSKNIYLFKSEHNIFSNNTVSKGIHGFYLEFGSNFNSIIFNNCSYNDIGIVVYGDSNNISNNIASNNIYNGISIGSHNNTVSHNNVTGNLDIGIQVESGGENIDIYYNYCGENLVGILVENSSKITIMGNQISRNFIGIELDARTMDSLVYLNNLSIHPNQNAFDWGINNSWDNGFIGNYWYDYSGKVFGASDIGGVWDLPYIIPGDGNSADNYPWVDPSGDFIPIANFTFKLSELYANQWIQFTDTSQRLNSPIIYQWNFGDGTSNYTESNPKHRYSSIGTYMVILTITDGDGDISVVSYIVRVKIPPIFIILITVTSISLILGVSVLVMLKKGVLTKLIKRIRNTDDNQIWRSPQSGQRVIDSIDNNVDESIINEQKLEEPVMLAIITNEAQILFSVPFTDDLHVDDALFGELITIFKNISDNLFSESLDSVKFLDYTLILKTIDPYTLCYIFKGHTLSAQQKMQHFHDILQKSPEILITLEKVTYSSQTMKNEEIPLMEELIKECFSSNPQNFQLPFRAYEGPNPFLFISYAHSDKLLVYPIIHELNKTGINIWYDEGIPISEDWKKIITKRINKCVGFLVFITPRIINSVYVRREISLALEKKKKIYAVYLKDTNLSEDLSLEISHIQAINKYLIPDKEFYTKLKEALLL